MAKLSVFSDPTEARAAKSEGDGVRFGAFVIVAYVSHAVDPVSIVNAVNKKALRPIKGVDTYDDRLRAGSRLLYFEGLGLGSEVNPITLESFQITPAGQVLHNLVWVEGSSTAMSVIPIKFASELPVHVDSVLGFVPTYELPQALRLEEVLSLIGYVTGASRPPQAAGNFSEWMRMSCEGSLEEIGVVSAGSQFLESSLGVDIWSLHGSLDRADDLLFESGRDAPKYSWPLSAIMSFTSDHVIAGKSSSRSHLQVYSEMSTGHAFMDDHAIFVNNSCCLEITHIDHWANSRSAARFRDYGYDSTSLYVWTISLVRSQTLVNVSDKYGDKITQLARRGTMSQSLEELGDMCAADLQLVDTLENLHYMMKEPRSQEIDRISAAYHGDFQRMSSARSRVEATRSLVSTRLEERDRHEREVADREEQLREKEELGRVARRERRRQEQMTYVTVVAAILAVAQIPSTVEQIFQWSMEHAYLRLATTVSVLLLALLALAVVPFLSHDGEPRQGPPT